MSRKQRASDPESAATPRLPGLLAVFLTPRHFFGNLFNELRLGARDLLLFAVASTLSAVGLSLTFQPLNWWPMAFVCLAPWALAACRATRPWVVHWLSFMVGWGFFLVNLQWLSPVTGLGYVALAFYLALYWTLAVWVIRTSRRIQAPVTFALPIAWVACEYLRAWVMSGFPWLFLAHGFAGVPILIQISDITGAYGVSFLAGMVNGFIVDLCLWLSLPASAPRRGRELRDVIWCAAATLAALVGTLSYGATQLKAEFTRGPRVAVVQEDFPLSNEPPYSAPFQLIFSRYLALGGQTAREQPDLIAFPETTSAGYQNIGFLEKPLQVVDDVPAGMWSFGRRCHDATAAFARGDYPAVNQVIQVFENSLHNRARDGSSTGPSLPLLPATGAPATVVIGACSIDLYPEATYPKYKRFNSALVYNPDGLQRRDRYDKRHLVPFGEYVPFRNATWMGVSLHWLYRWLNSLSPFSDNGKFEYSLWSGETQTVFDLAVPSGKFRFGTPICYEDVMPYVIRDYVWKDGQRRVDFLVNISNDGWFLHSGEIPQHLAICTFRAVENRVGIARSVNTGGSGFIDPCGRVYGLVNDHGRTTGPGIVGVSVQPVLIDSRGSFYGLHGDWFARLCLGLASMVWLSAIATRWVFAIYVRLFGGPREA